MSTQRVRQLTDVMTQCAAAGRLQAEDGWRQPDGVTAGRSTITVVASYLYYIVVVFAAFLLFLRNFFALFAACSALLRAVCAV